MTFSWKSAALTNKFEVTGEVPLIGNATTSARALPSRRAKSRTSPSTARNYLDLMQLVPGVLISKQNDPGTGIGSDTATSVLGERGNNTNFLIDGLPNVNQVNGGPAAQFNQDTIAEFQVITTGYAADFGHASGGIVNVITKSGTNDIHGVAFRRSIAATRSILRILPRMFRYLLRWDYSLAAVGGPIVKDKIVLVRLGRGDSRKSPLELQIPTGTPDSNRRPRSSNTTRPPRIAKRAHLGGSTRFSAATICPRSTTTRTRISGITCRCSSTRRCLPTGKITGRGARSTAPTTRRRSAILRVPGFSTCAAAIAKIQLVRSRASASRTLHALQRIPDRTIGGTFWTTPQVTFGSITSPSNLDQKYGFLGTSLAKTDGTSHHQIRLGLPVHPR